MVYRISIFLLSMLLSAAYPCLSLAQQGAIEGIITDAQTGETLIGAAIQIENSTEGTSSDLDGLYSFKNLKAGSYTLLVSYVSYKPQRLTNITVQPGKTTELTIVLESSNLQLSDVVVTVQKKLGTNMAVLNAIKSGVSVMNGISAQEISKTQDSDAAEVLRRIPGITIINDRFLVIRGLAQRYNGVWLNNATTPSTEADSRSFSFDMIPSSLIDNMMVYKSPSAELPADFAGGFVRILTKNVPSENGYNVNFQLGYNTNSTLQNFTLAYGDGLDYIGWGAGGRMLSTPLHIGTMSMEQTVDFTRANSHYWKSTTHIALPDMKAGFSTTQIMELSDWKIGNVSAIHWSIANQHYNQINNRYNSYDMVKQESVLNNSYQDALFQQNVQLGALMNWSFLTDGCKLEFKNFFNQKASNRLTQREGHEYYDDRYLRRWESLYSSRTTYSGQLAAEHRLIDNISKIDWTVGYAFANYLEPDRKLVEAVMREGDQINSAAPSFVNDAQRYDQKLADHSISVGWNYEHRWNVDPLFTPIVRAGAYGEYKNRSFDARKFKYIIRGNDYNKEVDWDYGSVFTADNYTPDRIYMQEETGKKDSYTADYLIGAAYISTSLNYGESWNAVLGLRMEYNRLYLDSYSSDNLTPVNINRNVVDLFPSIHLSYKITPDHILKASYARAVNRPEFREVAPYMFWDFNRFCFISGNPDLENCYNDHVDLRYEYYPSASEMISVGLFYKGFTNPIEESYVEAGSGLQYSYRNAKQAFSAGVEVEIKKSLEFISLKDLSIVLNGSYMYSRVLFAAGHYERDRPMAGQSPYMINAGLFYQNDPIGLSASLLYNCFGQRLETVGIAKQNPNEDIPDLYEMPFNSLDLTLTQQIGRHVELKLGAQNLLYSKVEYKQFLTIVEANKPNRVIEQTVRSYNPGIQINLGVAVKF